MALESRITQEEIKKEPEKPIDREKVENTLICTLVYVHFKITIAWANLVRLPLNGFSVRRWSIYVLNFYLFIIDNNVVT